MAFVLCLIQSSGKDKPGHDLWTLAGKIMLDVGGAGLLDGILPPKNRSSHAFPFDFRAPHTIVLQGSEFWGDFFGFFRKSQKKEWRREILKNGARDIFVWYLHRFRTSRIRS